MPLDKFFNNIKNILSNKDKKEQNKYDHELDEDDCKIDEFDTDGTMEKKLKLLEFIKCGDLSNVKRILVSREFRLNYTDDNGNTPLHIAVEYGHINIIQILLRYHARIDVLNVDKRTPLILASYKSLMYYEKGDMENFKHYIKITELLIKSGADPKPRDNEGNRFIEYIHKDHQSFFKRISNLRDNPFKYY